MKAAFLVMIDWGDEGPDEVPEPSTIAEWIKLGISTDDLPIADVHAEETIPLK